MNAIRDTLDGLHGHFTCYRIDTVNLLTERSTQTASSPSQPPSTGTMKSSQSVSLTKATGRAGIELDTTARDGAQSGCCRRDVVATARIGSRCLPATLRRNTLSRCRPNARTTRQTRAPCHRRGSIHPTTTNAAIRRLSLAINPLA